MRSASVLVHDSKQDQCYGKPKAKERRWLMSSEYVVENR